MFSALYLSIAQYPVVLKSNADGVLVEVAPTKIDNDEAKVVSINKGHLDVDQWAILVSGTFHAALYQDVQPVNCFNWGV